MRKKKILITGSTHGIGRAAARKFASQGWEVYGCAGNREDQRGFQMEEECPGFHFRYTDVSEEREVEGLLDWCGPIDAAFNNAGMGCRPAAIHLMDAGAARRVLEVNLLGTALCMKHECASMLAGGGGVIVNNASVAAFKAATGADALYAAAKAGVVRLAAEAAADREYRDRIKFFTLVPGWVETRMTAADDKAEWKRRLPSGKAGEPDQVAELLWRIVENTDCFDSGQEFQVNGGGILV